MVSDESAVLTDVIAKRDQIDHDTPPFPGTNKGYPTGGYFQ
jgi:hypothetical protein